MDQRLKLLQREYRKECRAEVLGFFAEFKKITCIEDNNFNEERSMGTNDKYDRLEAEIDLHGEQLEKDISSWTEDFCHTQLMILAIWMCIQQQKYMEIAGGVSNRRMEEMIELRRRLELATNRYMY
jgi:hypothetical protein